MRAVRKGKWKFVYFSDEKYELYDLSEDIGEEKDAKAFTQSEQQKAVSDR